MKRPLILSTCVLSAALLASATATPALAATPAPSAPAAPVVTSAIAGDKAILTITGEPGATATVFSDDHRAVAGTPLINGTARVVVPAPQGVTNTFAVSQSTASGANSAETTTVVSDGPSAALKPVELVHMHTSDSENGTLAQFFVSGAPHAIAKVTTIEGTVLAVASLGKEGSTSLTIEGLSHGATEVAITQTLGFATSAPLKKTVIGELLPVSIADNGSKVFYEIAGFPSGEAVAFDSDGNEVARAAITRKSTYLAVPHAAEKEETISIHREIDGELSTGVKRTLSGWTSFPLAPHVTHDPADDTDDALGVRIMEDPGFVSHSLRGATVKITTLDDSAEVSALVPTDFDGDNNLVRFPKSFSSGSPIIVHQIFEGIQSNWTYLKL